MVLLIGLLGLLGVGWDVSSRIRLQTGGERVSGRITGSDSRTQTVGRSRQITIYLLTFTYQAEGQTYNGEWEAPDESWLERMPGGTAIMVSYPPGKPNLAQPVGDPFDSEDNSPLAIIQEVLVEGFLPLLSLLAGIALLRGVWRGRMVLTRDQAEDM